MGAINRTTFMKRFISFFAAIFWAVSVPALPPPIQPNKATTNTVPPYVESNAGPGTNNTFYAPTVTASPNGTNMVRVMTVTMRTNQDLVIQDQYGNIISAIRRSKYTPGTNAEYFHNIGSPGSPIVDWEMDIASGGADIIWAINGDLNDAFRLNTAGGRIYHQFGNPTYRALGQLNLNHFDNFGIFYPVRIQSQQAYPLSVATVGAAAGSGATISGDAQTTDGNDVRCILALTTGTGTAAGTLFTYAFDTTPGAFILAPTVTFSAWDVAAAQQSSVVRVASTTTTFVFSSSVSLDASTTFTWNFHIIQ